MATEQVDQSFTTGLNFSASVGIGYGGLTYQYPGQVFTAGITGELTRIDLYLTYTGTPTNPINFAVSASDPTTGEPVGSVLASASRLSANQAGGTVPIDTGSAPAPTQIVFGSPASITAGSRYVVIASSAENGFYSNYYSLWFNSAGSYSGGNMVWENQSGWQRNLFNDAGFTTYVIAGGSSSAGGETSTSVTPLDILQQVSMPAGGCAHAVHSELNWSGVDTGGWSESWAEWANDGEGGSVCTRTLHLDEASNSWVVL